MAVIVVDELTKRYDDKVVVDEVSFEVEEGEIFAILGPNGAGKTTTVESIAGLRTPDSGRIEVFGYDPLGDRAEVRAHLGEVVTAGFRGGEVLGEAQACEGAAELIDGVPCGFRWVLGRACLL